MDSPLDQLSSRAKQWNVTIHNMLETNTSLVAFGIVKSLPVVLKIIKQQGDEWHSGSILDALAGHGTVKVYEFSEGAALLERLSPGTELVELVRTGADEEATRTLADVIKRMDHPAPLEGCPTVGDWSRGFDRYLQKGDVRIGTELVTEAHALYHRLATTTSHQKLLHGDLHHYNVLFDAERGWLAIDPKGVVGELEYELGAIIRNPGELPDLYLSPAVIERRLRTLTDALSLNYDRALQWSFAQAVLSAIWGIEDGFDVAADNPNLTLARTIKEMLK